MRWMVRVLSAVVVLALLAVLTLALIPSERIAALASAEFSRLTGRELVIEGAVNPSVWPVLGVETGRIRLANAGWSEEGPMLSAAGLSIGVDLAALLEGNLRITQLDLLRPEILLERAEDGVGNWEFADRGGGAADGASSGRSTQTGAAARPVTLEAGRIRDGRIIYIDHATGQRVVLEDVVADLALPAGAGAASLALEAMLGGRAAAVEARLPEAAVSLKGDVAPLALTARLGAARLSFDGRARFAPFAAEGALDAALGDLADLAAALAQPAPDLPDGWGARNVALKGALTVTAEQSLHLREATLTLDDRLVTGDADIRLAGLRPMVVAQIATGALVMGASGDSGGGGAGGASASSGAAPATGGWSDAAIDASALSLFDANIGFRTDGLTLGPLRLGAANGKLVIDRARASLTLAEVAAYGGALSGTLVANNRNGLSVSADVALRGVDVRPLLSDAAGVDRLAAKGDMAVNVLGSGQSVAAILSSLSGDARIALGPGRIEGVDLAAILATLDPARAAAGGATAFDGLDATFVIDRGQMRGDDLRLAGPLVTATGAGRIGIATRDIDYRLRPVALTGADGTGGLGVPVLITGPWSDPSIRIDLEALARERYGDELKAAEDEARARAAALEDELKAKAAEELGAAEGESLEDAARRRLEEEVQRTINDTLFDLLGGN